MTLAGFERRLAKVEAGITGGRCFVVFAGPAEGARGWEIDVMRQQTGPEAVAVYLGRQGGDKLRRLQQTRDMSHESWIDLLAIIEGAEAQGGSVEFLDMTDDKLAGADIETLSALTTWWASLGEREVYAEGRFGAEATNAEA